MDVMLPTTPRRCCSGLWPLSSGGFVLQFVIISCSMQCHKRGPSSSNLSCVFHFCFFPLFPNFAFAQRPSVCSSGSTLSCAVCSPFSALCSPVGVGRRRHQSYITRSDEQRTQNENAPTIRADISTHNVSSRAAWLDLGRRCRCLSWLWLCS
jgi:hypothetical protein